MELPRGAAVERVGRSGYICDEELHRIYDNFASDGALTLEIIGFLTLSVTAWLGGERVDRMGVGVDEGAHTSTRRPAL